MTAQHRELVTLVRGSARLQVCPSAGGSITRYCWQDNGRTVEWLWPARDEDIIAGNPLGMSCFPLVPFSSRVRDGRFVFHNTEVRLPLNFSPHPHTIHGHGWQAPWRVVEASEDKLIVEYVHTPDAWPWAYRARQTFVLDEAHLTVSIEVHNESTEAMPAGIGLHPYLVRTPAARVLGGCDKLWLMDSEVMPVERVEPPAGKHLGDGIVVDRVALDNTFTGWSGRAVVQWPEWDAQLTIDAGAPLSFLVVYSPPGEGFFCVEPVSNCTDAFNLAAAGRDDTGTKVLAPGESLAATIRFTPRLGINEGDPN